MTYEYIIYLFNHAKLVFHSTARGDYKNVPIELNTYMFKSNLGQDILKYNFKWVTVQNKEAVNKNRILKNNRLLEKRTNKIGTCSKTQ